MIDSHIISHEKQCEKYIAHEKKLSKNNAMVIRGWFLIAIEILKSGKITKSTFCWFAILTFKQSKVV